MAITGRLRDKGLFKVPTLRQIKLTAPYMHDGSVPTLRAVVEGYVQASNSMTKIKDSEMLPMELTESDINDLVEYLNAL